MKVVNGETEIKEDKEGAGFYLFLQYHLAKQMATASAYARAHRVVLKGDLPIGIYRFSVDAWMAPHLFNMACQTGAPPDAFAVQGQNWGFPTYNWHVMAQDNFQWWRSRLTGMAKYFDAYRIDHILGFFRIWEIPYASIQGLLGQFSPAHSLSIRELQERGVNFDYNRLCKPYVRGHLLHQFVGGEHIEKVIKEFLNGTAPNVYEFKPQFDTQRKIAEYISAQLKITPELKGYYERVKPGLFGMIEEVLFLEAPFSHGTSFTPRISLAHTCSFRELDWAQQAAINETYVHYYYHRQESLWAAQAMQKLPAIVNATNMLVCGEDLGMVPACVGPIMEQLGILSLNIQRMPKDPKKAFFHPGDSHYLSVATTSSHDMSTLRAWWQENPEETKQFYKEILGHDDACPYFCEDWVAKEIISQHLYCPAMWTIFPIQDLLAMDGKLRLTIPEQERVNVPANPHHYWRYRLHLSVEDLQKATAFNEMLKTMLTASGRNNKY
jgi:4-alpha-glucanotransferase